MWWQFSSQKVKSHANIRRSGLHNRCCKFYCWSWAWIFTPLSLHWRKWCVDPWVSFWMRKNFFIFHTVFLFQKLDWQTNGKKVSEATQIHFRRCCITKEFSKNNFKWLFVAKLFPKSKRCSTKPIELFSHAKFTNIRNGTSYFNFQNS